MSEHNEPWEVIIDGCINPVLISSSGHTIIGKQLHRAALCVNACAGMSDEEVAGLTKYPQMALQSGIQMQIIKDESAALKVELNEAVSLLDQHCHSHHFSNCGDETCGDCTVCNSLTFLTSYREANNE